MKADRKPIPTPEEHPPAKVPDGPAAGGAWNGRNSEKAHLGRAHLCVGAAR